MVSRKLILLGLNGARGFCVGEKERDRKGSKCGEPVLPVWRSTMLNEYLMLG